LARNENSNPKKQKFHAKALRDRKEKPLRILCVSAPTRRGALLIFFFLVPACPVWIVILRGLSGLGNSTIVLDVHQPGFAAALISNTIFS